MAALLDKPGFPGAVARFYRRSYAADYVGYVLLQLAYFAVSLSRMTRNLLHTDCDQVPSLHNPVQTLLHPLRYLDLLPFRRSRTRPRPESDTICRRCTSDLLHSVHLDSQTGLP